MDLLSAKNSSLEIIQPADIDGKFAQRLSLAKLLTPSRLTTTVAKYLSLYSYSSLAKIAIETTGVL